MKAKSRKLIKSVILIASMVLGLVGVFYAMQYTRTPSFQSSLELFFNPSLQKSWKWCPLQTETVSWVDHQAMLESSEIHQVCEVEMQSIDSPVAEQSGFKPLLVAKARAGSRTLESDPQMELFRIDGLPFKSLGLSEFLKNLKTRPTQN
jgi:hypothetical protein